MKNTAQSGEPIEQELQGEPLRFGDRVLQPVVQMRGRRWRWTNPDPAAKWTGVFDAAYVHLTPRHVEVTDAQGQAETIVMPDVTGEALRGIRMAALSVSAVCLLVILVRKLLG